MNKYYALGKFCPDFSDFDNEYNLAIDLLTTQIKLLNSLLLITDDKVFNELSSKALGEISSTFSLISSIAEREKLADAAINILESSLGSNINSALSLSIEPAKYASEHLQEDALNKINKLAAASSDLSNFKDLNLAYESSLKFLNDLSLNSPSSVPQAQEVPKAHFSVITGPDFNENIYSLGDGKFYYANEQLNSISTGLSLELLESMGVNKITDLNTYGVAFGTDGIIYSDADVGIVVNDLFKIHTFDEINAVLKSGTYAEFAYLTGGKITYLSRDEFDGDASAVPLDLAGDEFFNQDGKLCINVGEDIKGTILVDHSLSFAAGMGIALDQAKQISQHMLSPAISFSYSGAGMNGTQINSSLILSQVPNGLKISMNGYSFSFEGRLDTIISDLLRSNGELFKYNSEAFSLEQANGKHFGMSHAETFNMLDGLPAPHDGENLYNFNDFIIYSKCAINNAANLSLGELKASGARLVGIINDNVEFNLIDLERSKTYSFAHESLEASFNEQYLSYKPIEITTDEHANAAILGLNAIDLS